MLLVVFGAGASYDSYSSQPAPSPTQGYQWPRPPLANQLFVENKYFREIASNYRKCAVLIPYLEPIAGGQTSIEDQLSQIALEDDVDVKRQLCAVRYYINDVVQQTQNRWKETTGVVSNYKTLLEQIRLSREAAAFVTFNYDTLLDQELPKDQIQIDDVLAYPYPLFKLHGSISWARLVHSTKYREAPEIIEHVEELQLGDIFSRQNIPVRNLIQHSVEGRWPHMPAIAIPVTSKSEFECPPKHIDQLTKTLPQVTHLLAIGWKGGEKSFLDLLQKHAQQLKKYTIVCGGRDYALRTLEAIGNAGIQGGGTADARTFTEFVRERGISTLLSS